MSNSIINAILSEVNMKPGSFAKAIGVHPTQIYDLQSGKTKNISIVMADKIIDAFPRFSKSFLLTGEGEMLKEDTQKGESKGRAIPLYDAETTGGHEGNVSDSNVDVQLVGYIQPGGWFDGRETAAIRHVGDSMTEYPNGCILAVREVTERHLLVPGKNYVVETSEYRVTKRVQRGSTRNSIALYSTNKEKYEDGRLIYEPFEIELSDVRRIFSVLGYIVNQSGEYRLIKAR